MGFEADWGYVEGRGGRYSIGGFEGVYLKKYLKTNREGFKDVWRRRKGSTPDNVAEI